MDAGAISCARCEYDLRTLDASGVCPECALPISQSLSAALDPIAPVRRALRRATTILLMAIAVRSAFALVLAAYHIWAGRGEFVLYAVPLVLDPWPIEDVMNSWGGGMSRMSHGAVILTTSFTVAFVLQCAGTWLFTGNVAPRGTPLLARRFARWSFAIALGLEVITLVDFWFDVANLSSLSYKPIWFLTHFTPPAALVIWTTTLWSRLARVPRGGHIAWAFVALAASYSSLDTTKDGSPRPLQLLFELAALWAFAVMWYDLWQLSGPARYEAGGADKMP